MKGRFIVFEGPHGSGKTTQARLLKSYLDEHETPTVCTKEPFLEQIRELVNRHSDMGNEALGQLLLYLHAADRLVHVEYINQGLASGKVMISDRYLPSSCVYQHIQGIPMEFIERVNSFCIVPDMMFVLNVPLALTT